MVMVTNVFEASGTTCGLNRGLRHGNLVGGVCRSELNVPGEFSFDCFFLRSFFSFLRFILLLFWDCHLGGGPQVLRHCHYKLLLHGFHRLAGAACQGPTYSRICNLFLSKFRYPILNQDHIGVRKSACTLLEMSVACHPETRGVSYSFVRVIIRPVSAGGKRK